jgi:addiction module HigA family antidote
LSPPNNIPLDVRRKSALEYQQVRTLKMVHPGDVLRRELTKRAISPGRMARDIRVPPSRIIAILSRQRSISAETALRLAKYFGTSPRVWLDLQSAYDLKVADRENGKTIRREVIRWAA